MSFFLRFCIFCIVCLCWLTGCKKATSTHQEHYYFYATIDGEKTDLSYNIKVYVQQYQQRVEDFNIYGQTKKEKAIPQISTSLFLHFYYPEGLTPGHYTSTDFSNNLNSCEYFTGEKGQYFRYYNDDDFILDIQHLDPEEGISISFSGTLHMVEGDQHLRPPVIKFRGEARQPYPQLETEME